MAETIRRQKHLWGIVALLWLVLISRVSLSVNPNALDNIDAAGFDRLALNLLAGHGFTMDSDLPFCPESVRTPVYPVFLAGIYSLFGHQLRMAFLAQGLLDLVVAAVVFRLSAALWPRRRVLAGMLALGCYGIALSQWRFDNELLSEGLLTPLLALAVFGFWASTRNNLSRRLLPALLAGICLGLVILCKPNYELAPLVFLAGYAILPTVPITTRFRLGLALAVGLAVILAPWYIRNRATFGDFFLSHTYDDNVARVSAVATAAEVNHETVPPWSDRWEAIYGTFVSAAAAEYRWDNSTNLSCAIQDQRRQDVATVALNTIRANPQAFVLSYVKGAAFALLPQEQFYWYERLTGKPLDASTGWAGKPPLLLAMWVIWLVGYGLAYAGIIVGALTLWKRQRHLVIVMLGLMVFGLFLPGPLSYMRFRVPVVPLMVVMQGIGWLALIHFITRRLAKRAA